jgi:hypothetical protein
MSEVVRLHSTRGAAEWKENPDAAAEIEAHLATNGFDEIAVNAEVFIQAQREFAMFDSLMHAAQHRRMALFREIGIRREVLNRAREATRSERLHEFQLLGKAASEKINRDLSAAAELTGGVESTDPARSGRLLVRWDDLS